MTILRAGKVLGVIAVASAFALTCYVAIRYQLALRGLTRLPLRADVVVHQTSIGIPGITKTYEATLTNEGLLPVLIERCDFTSDTAQNGTMVAYNIERLDRGSGSWVSVLKLAEPDFCLPQAGGMGNTRWRAMPCYGRGKRFPLKKKLPALAALRNMTSFDL